MQVLIMAFLNNRINGSLDVYFKKTKDLLNTIPIPAGSNFSSTILTNVGNVENKGSGTGHERHRDQPQ